MKRAMGALVTLLALALPPPAVAASFTGTADPAGTVSFDLIRNAGATAIKDFVAHGIPVDCAQGSYKASGRLTFKIAVRDGRFSATADDGSGSSFALHGRLVHRRQRARGTIRIHGSSVPTDDGRRHSNCDSGPVPFHAHRP